MYWSSFLPVPCLRLIQWKKVSRASSFPPLLTNSPLTKAFRDLKPHVRRGVVVQREPLLKKNHRENWKAGKVKPKLVYGDWWKIWKEGDLPVDIHSGISRFLSPRTSSAPMFIGLQTEGEQAKQIERGGEKRGERERDRHIKTKNRLRRT